MWVAAPANIVPYWSRLQELAQFRGLRVYMLHLSELDRYLKPHGSSKSDSSDITLTSSDSCSYVPGVGESASISFIWRAMLTHPTKTYLIIVDLLY